MAFLLIRSVDYITETRFARRRADPLQSRHPEENNLPSSYGGGFWMV